MNVVDNLVQLPNPGVRLVKFRGDMLTFALTLPHPQRGSAWVRANLGHAKPSREEIIREVEHDETRMGRDWFDIPMHQVDETHFTVTLPIIEVGHFEAKCFFLKKGELSPIWPQGPNVAINVQPADACCANIIYNAFVRQFGPNKAGRHTITSTETETIQNLDNAGYTVIPPSGTFRDLIAEVDFIFGTLGCTILMLLPIHPTPTTYGRMGRFGSPYAALSFTAVDPTLAVFDPHATPLEQFIELADAVHYHNGKLFIDIAINHTGWAASLHETHPNWLVRGDQGRIEVPGAWGVRWEDLTKLDYSKKDLWRYMADIFIIWCRRGVDGFRCDAGYMIPDAAWKYIIAKVRDQYPDTVFLLEGLGGKISVTRDLLNTSNLNWAYSELFQNYDRSQVENYLPEAIDISASDGILVHFAETHDNPRLAARSRQYARMRVALCALCSHHGAFGFANGVEWFATEKINVHDSPSLNWGAECNQVDHIRRLSRMLKAYPAFHDETAVSMCQQNGGNHIVVLRHHVPSGKKLLVVVNLDDENASLASWNPTLCGMQDRTFTDLISGKEITVTVSDALHTFLLEPGQALCLSRDPADLKLIEDMSEHSLLLPQRKKTQRMRAKVLEVFSYYNRFGDLAEFDINRAISQFKKDPKAFCADQNLHSDEPRVVTWRWPQDIRREVMLPPGHFLLINADAAFRARIMDASRTIGSEDSLAGENGSYFALFSPLPTPTTRRSLSLNISVYSSQGCRHETANIVVLPRAGDLKIKKVFRRPELLHNKLLFLSTNSTGGMLRAPVSWGKLTSRYDALLAANINPDYPEDRWIMLTRCRAWVVYQDYSQEVNTSCLEAFDLGDSFHGRWQFHIPTGQGENILMILMANMIKGENTVRLTFYRHPTIPQQSMLDDSKPIKLILRPDIDHRSFHETTKAYTGPERSWPESIVTHISGFRFKPHENHHLSLNVTTGEFIWEPEWHYMVHHPIDAERGMDPNSDLFSPGYFQIYLKGNQSVVLSATTQPAASDVPMLPRTAFPSDAFESEKDKWEPPLELLEKAIDHYVVRRGQLKTVIAGYPWFLDWGRDALIFTRGLIASQKTAAARSILQQFAKFEDNGTLPNMIVAKNAGNRDTSDAPLWLFTACADLIRVEESDDFLKTDCSQRSMQQILLSIAKSIMAGAPNGVRMDPESGLIFSPAHFSWMDTDHPAATPRQGYPIEIQALWFAALGMLSKIDTDPNSEIWDDLANQVQASIKKYFWRDDLGYLSDCLHATSGHSASQAVPDDALRPNQLLAITLGAVSDKHICRQILAACEELLVPGAIRSLADRPVQHPIEIVYHNNRLNDPHHPYQGRYIGDEDTRRKPAYHNGTAWTWLFPTFCEAWAMVYGDGGKETASAWLTSGAYLMEDGCVGHIPEILDGDYPHTQRGCDAQAWGVSELLRVWRILHDERTIA
ncbi:MAG: glycogen debranching enzyme N-terminal domain-containing protein [Desulfobacterales bacterium]|nr:MAG: glycogen debranching enzyme N-terminal domain-containing protein [Desulfobacterales bacterium]